MPSKRSPGRPRTNEMLVPTTSQILTTAARLFMESGYEAVTVEKVAEECGLTKAAVYYHYRTKAALFTAAILKTMQSVVERTCAILLEERPLYDRLVQIAAIRMKVTQPYRDFDDMIREAGPTLTKEQQKAMKESEMELQRVFVQEFTKATEAGEIKPVDPLIASHSYLKLVTICKAVDENGDWLFADTDKAAKDVMKIFWSGISLPSGE